jgi:ankyrin repeat protein
MDKLPQEIMEALAAEDADGLSVFLASQSQFKHQALRAASILGSACCAKVAATIWDDVLERDHQSFTALHHAARGGHAEVFEQLWSLHKDGDRSDIPTTDARISRLSQLWGGVTSLHLAAASGETACVKFLLSLRADPAATDNNGWTAADHAKGKSKILALFPDCPQSMLETSEYEQLTRQRNEARVASLTPGHFSELIADADDGDAEALHDLLYCADIKNVKIGTSSALAAATSLGSDMGLRMVLQALSVQGKPGHDPEAAEAIPGLNDWDSLGLAPIHSAVQTGFAQSLVALLDARADVNRRTADASYKLGQTTTVYNEGGRTALHMAVHRLHLPCVEALLAAGADRTEEDSFGLNALDVALECLALPTRRVEDQSRIMQLLGIQAEASGMDINSKRERVEACQKTRESALRSRILETEKQQGIAKRQADRQKIQECYAPFDACIFRGDLGAEVYGRDVVSWSNSSSLAGKDFARQCALTGSCETGIEEKVPGVFVFPLLSESLCSRIWAETENYLGQAGELNLPMPVRHDGGLDLSYVFPELLTYIANAAM